MFRIFRYFVARLWTGDAPAESPAAPGEAPPPAPPPAAPPPAEAAPPGPPVDPLDAAGAASANRILGAETPEALVPDDVVYRDAKALREEVTRAKQEYGPYAEAFANLSADEREAVVTFAPAAGLARVDPAIGADLGMIQAAYPQLSTEDRATVADIVGGIASDPQGSVELIRQAAALLRGDEAPPAAEGAPAEGEATTDEFGFALDDPQRPLTQAEFDRRIQEHDQQRENERAQADASQAILTEMKELGYDPASQDLIQAARAEALIGMARRLPNGSIADAHVEMQKWEQSIIDQYASGKLANVRPQLPGDSASPSGERVLESLDDGTAAMTERLRAQGLRV